MALTTVPSSLSATALTLTTAAQPNITSLGTLTALNTSGNVGIGTSNPASLLHLSSYAPVLSFTDTNSFTDVNDRFIVRASTDKGNIQWYDDSASTTTELMTFLPSGAVGIGTSSPAAAKFSSTPDGVLNLSGNKPVVYLTEEDETDSNVWIGLSNEVGIIGNTGDALAFRTGSSTATEAMRIDADRNLLVGTQTAHLTSSTFAGYTQFAGGHSIQKRSGGIVAYYDRLTDDGTIMQFRRQGTIIGSIQSRAGVVSTIILDPRTNGAGLTGSTNGLIPVNQAGSTADNHVDLGSSSSRFKEGFFSSNLNITNPSEDERGLSITDEQDGGQNLKFLYNASSNVGRVINDQVDQLRFNGADGAMINTPSFSAYATSNQTTVTNGAATKINFGSQIVDTAGGHYATSTSRFVAPHDGTYFFSTNITYAGGDGVDDTMYVDYRVNGAFYTAYRFKDNWRYHSRSGIENTANYSLLIPLSASDYVEVFYAGTSYAITIDGGNSKFSGFAVSLT